MNPKAELDIRRPYAMLAVCPTCRREQELPEDWRTILAESEGQAGRQWDGLLRCWAGGHPLTEMVVTPIRNPALPERDGIHLVHLVQDDDHRRAACTGELWGGLPDPMPPGGKVRLCPACARCARS
jgi:hypothetical protein